ncbi:MAG: MFS transporter [Chloroflexales bacterium]|nr:MFS transporter [Chloroflexales bacterium]
MAASPRIHSASTPLESTQTEAAPEQKKRQLRLPAMLRALRHRNYRLFFIGQLISLTGTWMQTVAQGWLVLRLTDSPLLLGLVAAFASLPILLFSLPAGALADRVPKRTLLLTTQVIAMLLALVLALLTLTGLVQVWHVLLLAALLGLVNAFDAPARQAFTVEMVGRADLLNAIALNSSIFNGARTIGPAVAGMVVAAIGEGPAFLLNGLSFLAVIAGLLMMRLPPFQAPSGARRTNQLREGLRYIAGEPAVRSLLLLAGSLSLFGFVYIPLLPVFARDVLGAGASGLGWLSAASGLGALTAALLLAQFSDRVRRGHLVIAALLAYPVFMIGFTLARSLPLAMILLALSGLSGVTAMALINTLIQSIVPDTLRGRVMSVFTLLLMGLSPLGGMFAGVIAEYFGSVTLVVATSAALAWLICLFGILRAPHLRQL